MRNIADFLMVVITADCNELKYGQIVSIWKLIDQYWQNVSCDLGITKHNSAETQKIPLT